jgi:hypothetical protein
MSVAHFSEVLKSKVYKQFLETIGRNIIQQSTNVFRASEQVASKTSFYLDSQTLQNMYKTIVGKDLSTRETNKILNALLEPSKKGPNAAEIKVEGRRAIFFQNIGFGTISDKIKAVMFDKDKVNEFEAALSLAEENYLEAEKARIKQKYDLIEKRGTLPQAEIYKLRKEEFDKAEKQAKIEGGLGYYFNKGHVISIATNLTKKFRNEVAKAQGLAEAQQKRMLDVLDAYIARLQADDLASANLPNAIDQELYASYLQNPDSYLVEFQLRSTNLESGDVSKEVIAELRDLLGPDSTEKALLSVIEKNPNLATILLDTEGSGKPIDKIIDNILSPFPGRKKPSSKASPKVLIGKKKYPIIKKNNKESIRVLKEERNKLARVKRLSEDKLFTVRDSGEEETSVVPNLQLLLDAKLVQTVKQNMGDGGSRNVLNLRSGRFAESVKVESISQSRQGMITAFYTYMRNPYATFSAGGRQQFPRSRDPKLLISKSIRQLATELTITRLRAQLV